MSKQRVFVNADEVAAVEYTPSVRFSYHIENATLKIYLKQGAVIEVQHGDADYERLKRLLFDAVRGAPR